MLIFIKFLKLKVPNYFWITAGLHISEGVQILQYLLWSVGLILHSIWTPWESIYFRGGPNTSVLFWSTRTGVQILRSIWTGGNHFGGVHFLWQAYTTSRNIVVHFQCSWDCVDTNYPGAPPTSVGATWSISSFSDASTRRMVVLPALSRPSKSIRSSRVGCFRRLLSSDNKPWRNKVAGNHTPLFEGLLCMQIIILAVTTPCSHRYTDLW